MIAVDTNILARLLLKDDPRQFEVARSLFAQQRVFVAPVTVLLELVWVLETRQVPQAHIVSALRMLLALPNFKTRDPEALMRALEWYDAGVDFADALHVALSAQDEMFLSFDRKLEKASGKRNVTPKVVVPK